MEATMTPVRWTKGYTEAECERAQSRHGLAFPPDLVALFKRKRPVDGHDWTDDAAIKRACDWPLDGLISVERGQIWWPEWGEEPRGAGAPKTVWEQLVT